MTFSGDVNVVVEVGVFIDDAGEVTFGKGYVCAENPYAFADDYAAYGDHDETERESDWFTKSEMNSMPGGLDALIGSDELVAKALAGSAKWDRLMAAFPWDEDEPISGADLVDFVSELLSEVK